MRHILRCVISEISTLLLPLGIVDTTGLALGLLLSLLQGFQVYRHLVSFFLDISKSFGQHLCLNHFFLEEDVGKYHFSGFKRTGRHWDVSDVFDLDFDVFSDDSFSEVVFRFKSQRLTTSILIRHPRSLNIRKIHPLRFLGINLSYLHRISTKHIHHLSNKLLLTLRSSLILSIFSNSKTICRGNFLLLLQGLDFRGIQFANGIAIDFGKAICE